MVRLQRNLTELVKNRFRGWRADFSSFVVLYRDCERGHSLAVREGVDPRRYECRMSSLDYFLTFLVPRGDKKG